MTSTLPQKHKNFHLIHHHFHQNHALSGNFQCAYCKMHAQILLGMQWCVMSIFFFLKFYIFIKGIMRMHSIF